MTVFDPKTVVKISFLRDAIELDKKQLLVTLQKLDKNSPRHQLLNSTLEDEYLDFAIEFLKKFQDFYTEIAVLDGIQTGHIKRKDIHDTEHKGFDNVTPDKGTDGD